MGAGLDPGFHQRHGFVAVPVGVIFIQDGDVRALVKEIGIPRLAPLLRMVIAGRASEHNNVCVLRDLAHRARRAHLRLRDGIGVHGACPRQNGVVVAAVQVALMRGGIGGDDRYARVHQVFNIRGLRRVVV